MHAINRMMTEISNLDTYSQLSVLGSWSFIVNAAGINQAMKFVPDNTNESGIDGYTPYEAARRHLLREAETSYVPAFIALMRDVGGMITEANGEARDPNNTLEFLTSNVPSAAQFDAEFEHRRRLGMKPQISKKQFVEAEFERAMAQHNALVAKGQDAVRLLETISVKTERGYDDLPDWVAETFERKLLEKLHTRWEKLERSRTNPRYRKEIRDGAAADQMLIEQLLAEYGEKPGYSDDESEQA